MQNREKHGLNRRAFGTAVAGLTAAGAELVRAAGGEGEPAAETKPFAGPLEFARKPVAVRVKPFPLAAVRLGPGVLHEAQRANLAFVLRLDPDRLLHNFRVNAGLPSSAAPLGGWEKPDCELRGHFVGHYLSACALLHSSTGNEEVKTRGQYLVRELAKCQEKLGGGYLSAFPTTYFDRLKARTKVWAPFYTLHKIMAGMYEMHGQCGDAEALSVLRGMAGWADNWSAALSEAQMQSVLDTEYGGMNDILYKLSAETGEDRYARAGDRFTKQKFFTPLALHKDELRGLHVNTHIPQVIGAASRYELSGDERFRAVAEFFWWDVTGARCYVTGGTSNNEAWLTEPGYLAAELKQHDDTTEDCCAYNMLKLTRQLYTWTADPRFFDYYERTLWNHRMPAINRKTGATQYYLSLTPGAWKTFSTENDSFWCCTGTGVEEFAKLQDSIYFHDRDGLYVNLFIPSEVKWEEKGLRLQQMTSFPEEAATQFVVQAAPQEEVAVHLRVPEWAGQNGRVSLNGKPLEVQPAPGSYLTLRRTWQAGDRILMDLPMHLRTEAMPDEPSLQAVLYGPLVLAGKLGAEGLTPALEVGPMGPDVRKHPVTVPAFQKRGRGPEQWIEAVRGQPLTFRAAGRETMGQQRELTLVPFYQLFGERYSIYWQMA